MRPTAVSAAGLVFLFFMVAFTGFHGIPTGSSVLAAVGEEEEDNTHKYAGEKGFRQGKVTKKSIEIVLDGKSVGELTEQDLTQLDEKQIYSPRGPKVGWRVMDAINGEGIKSGKAVHFLNGRGKRLDL
ncbi:MAG TPA: hypothetical protein VIU33_09505, partial [Nitrospiria bacterium]